MTMRRLYTKTLFATMIAATTIHAQDSSRAGSWEFFLAPQFTNGKTLDFDNGAKAELNDRSSLGLGFGYNVDTHIELTLLFAASSSNYKGTSVADDETGKPETFASNLYTSTMDIGFTYNFLDAPFTPFVSANLGSTYIDSGISTGNVNTGCYWHPWYGYGCFPYDETYTAFRLNYGASIGVRYDLKNKLYFKGSIGKDYVDIDNSSDPGFTRYQLTIGSMF